MNLIIKDVALNVFCNKPRSESEEEGCAEHSSDCWQNFSSAMHLQEKCMTNEITEINAEQNRDTSIYYQCREMWYMDVHWGTARSAQR